MVISERSTRAVAAELGRRLGGRAVVAISEVPPHVPRTAVDAARADAVDGEIDVVVTVGGGSATGLGKTVVLELGVPLIAIPTTYAGSEITSIYGMTEEGTKKTGRDERVLPKTVIYDPELTTSLPARVTASSGMNAIAHCVEALYAERPSPVAGALSEEAIGVLRRALPRCVADPTDKDGRTDALYGAYLAGTVLATSGMAIHHRICHVLGGTYGLPHGDANAIVLPHAVAFNEPAAPIAIARVARSLDADSAAPALFDLARSLGAPTSLRELGFDGADLEGVADRVAGGDFYNPRPAGRDEIMEILGAAFEGTRPGGSPRLEKDRL